MELLRGGAFKSLPVDACNILPCQIRKAGKRHQLPGCTQVTPQLSSNECRRRSHASAEPRNRIDTEKLPSGPQEGGQKWHQATVVENKWDPTSFCTALTLPACPHMSIRQLPLPNNLRCRAVSLDGRMKTLVLSVEDKARPPALYTHLHLTEHHSAA